VSALSVLLLARRLSYYGGGHYDSIVGADHRANLMRSHRLGCGLRRAISSCSRTLPGVFEDRRIEYSRSREVIGSGEEMVRVYWRVLAWEVRRTVPPQKSNVDASRAEEMEIQAAIQVSRDEFDRLDGDTDHVFESVGTLPPQQHPWSNPPSACRSCRQR
jgi:hypothetical protein